MILLNAIIILNVMMFLIAAFAIIWIFRLINEPDTQEDTAEVLQQYFKNKYKH